MTARLLRPSSTITARPLPTFCRTLLGQSARFERKTRLQRLHDTRSQGRCSARPTDPGVGPLHTSNPHAHPAILLPLNGQSVPPDPTCIALSQPPTAALSYAVREVLLHVALPLLALWILQRLLGRLEKRTRQEAATTTAGSRTSSLPLARELADLLPGAATVPSRVTLVLLTATHVARSMANIVQGLAERLLLAAGGVESFESVASSRAGHFLASFKSTLGRLDRALIVAYQVLLVAFGCWVLLSWKDVAVSRFMERREDTVQGKQDLARIITPLNTVATWALLLAAGVVTVSLLGVDVRPLLVLTGGGSLVAGLASQQLLSNAVSGVQMYLDRPFQVGDTITVSSGVNSYTGEVVEIAALRTLIALEDGSTVAIPNRSLSDMIITNKSRSGKRASRPPWVQSRAPLSLQLRIRLKSPEYVFLQAQLQDLRNVIIGSGAVEDQGLAAPRVEVIGYSERGVELLAGVRLRNPSKVAAAAASGGLARAAAQAPQLVAGAIRASTTDHAQGPAHGGGDPVPNVTGGGPGSDGDGAGGARATRAGITGVGGSYSDEVRALRQQLLLELGPWLQANNGTLVVE